MAKWTKDADWLPYRNALEQVIFWKDDLIKIQSSLRILEIMKVPTSDEGYKLTLKEIETSKRGLAIAQFKLKEALERLTVDDKINFKTELGF